MAGNGGNARMFLARELRSAREIKGMSRATLAKKFYVSESLIKLWETGRRVPTIDDMEKLDDLFGMMDSGLLGAVELAIPLHGTAALESRLAALTALAASHLEESTYLTELRDTLLPKLMSGEIRIRDAEKLVERVT